MGEILNLSVGRSRKETEWKNKEISWNNLKDKLTRPNRTSERYDEYIHSQKNRQLEIKDVGGFVGGIIKNGRRKPENIVLRSMLTLDVDYAKDVNDLVDTLELLYNCEA